MQMEKKASIYTYICKQVYIFKAVQTEGKFIATNTQVKTNKQQKQIPKPKSQMDNPTFQFKELRKRGQPNSKIYPQKENSKDQIRDK